LFINKSRAAVKLLQNKIMNLTDAVGYLFVSELVDFVQQGG